MHKKPFGIHAACGLCCVDSGANRHSKLQLAHLNARALGREAVATALNIEAAHAGPNLPQALVSTGVFCHRSDQQIDAAINRAALSVGIACHRFL